MTLDNQFLGPLALLVVSYDLLLAAQNIVADKVFVLGLVTVVVAV